MYLNLATNVDEIVEQDLIGGHRSFDATDGAHFFFPIAWINAAHN